jgi:hypothetical protein
MSPSANRFSLALVRVSSFIGPTFFIHRQLTEQRGDEDGGCGSLELSKEIIRPSDTIVSITLLTPIDETLTELRHHFSSSLNFTKYLSWPLRSLGKTVLK